MAHAWKACWCNSLTSSNLVFSARIGTLETVGIIRFLGFLLFHSVFRFLPDSLRMLLSLASVFESSRIASLACTGRHPGKSLIACCGLLVPVCGLNNGIVCPHMSIFDCDSVGELRTSSFYAHFCAALRYARNRDVERKKHDDG